jgi:hypothetical protein
MLVNLSTLHLQRGRGIMTHVDLNSITVTAQAWRQAQREQKMVTMIYI